MIRSKLTKRSRTTVPKPVRDALQLRPGDDMAYVIEGRRACITNAAAAGSTPFATFTEWESDVDRQAYAKL